MNANLIFLFILILGLSENAKTQNQMKSDYLYVNVVGKEANPLEGVTIMQQPGDLILAVTDSLGKAAIPIGKLVKDAKLLFRYIGYKKTLFSANRLRKNGNVIMEIEEINLDDVTVLGITTEGLIKEAKSKSKRSKRREFVDYYERYYGDAQYVKVTECLGRTVEFRREYGCFLTTGNIKQGGDFSDSGVTYDDLQNNSWFQEIFTGKDYLDYEQKCFLEEVKNKIGENTGRIFELRYRRELNMVFDRMLGRIDISKRYKEEILKYRGGQFSGRYADVFNKYDMLYDFSFIPAYSQRSLSLDALGKDTLPAACNLEFDAGSNKLFTIMRCIYLYAPIFSPSSVFKFSQSDVQDTNNYIVDFITDTKKYPRETSMFSKGRLWIDRENHHLVKMQFDFCYYHLYRLSRSVGEYPPYETGVVAYFDYDEDGVCYIKSCNSVTYWPMESEQKGVSVMKVMEFPSRLQPEKVGLVEKEGFEIYSLEKISSELQTQELGKEARYAAINPTGEYKKELFDRLGMIWDYRKDWVDLNQFMPIEEQFRWTSGRNYYAVENEFKQAGERIMNARNNILSLFFDKGTNE